MSTDMENNTIVIFLNELHMNSSLNYAESLTLYNIPNNCTKLGLGRLVPTTCHQLFSSFVL